MPDNGYGIMPNAILFDKDLSSSAKLLFCLISSLCLQKDYCWASNKYLATQLGVSEVTISRLISSLSKYLIVENGSNQLRRISLNKNDKAIASLIKNDKVPYQKRQGSLIKNDKHKNTIKIINKKGTLAQKEINRRYGHKSTVLPAYVKERDE